MTGIGLCHTAGLSAKEDEIQSINHGHRAAG